MSPIQLEKCPISAQKRSFTFFIFDHPGRRDTSLQEANVDVPPDGFASSRLE